ncbi:hypothetical protein TW83_08860 [Paracoccus sp. S4493]|nr:hypothetical protein TW83_08860 [Paracoccus sp. S4493]
MRSDWSSYSPVIRCGRCRCHGPNLWADERFNHARVTGAVDDFVCRCDRQPTACAGTCPDPAIPGRVSGRVLPVWRPWTVRVGSFPIARSSVLPTLPGSPPGTQKKETT